ncbi:lysophospholipid acyltransferase family protein [Reichenbachiella versicolor]|uniref:lysophospholipid acyltransferase family protein n=1 Tax=Reichenbachiella versicolor TaxID=1821036 RepID=UPI0013A58A0F|nr:lysophospholipid acyltransferase family protein [Reichenbachiella versicolor]
MIYETTKCAVAFAVKRFYQTLEVKGYDNVPQSGPIILVSNHPNTLMDPYIIATQFKRRVGFLGNASIFINPIAKRILTYFNVIPVYRKQDVKDGQKTDNSSAFSACYKYLENNNALLIFPEGTSVKEYRLRKIKTGTARIALGTEKQNNFNLGVKILPVGLYYNNPTQFGSKAFMQIGKPIDIKQFKEYYLKDEIEGVQSLTKVIRKSLTELTININNKEDEQVFIDLKQVYKSHLKELNKELKDFEMAKEMTNAIIYFKTSFPERYKSLKSRIHFCAEYIKDHKLRILEEKPKKRHSFVSISKLLIGLPLFVFGWLQNAFPFYVPDWLSRKLTNEIEYKASILVSIGLLLFPTWYFLSSYLFIQTTSFHWSINLAYIALLPLSGVFAIKYSNVFKKLKTAFRSNNTNFAEFKESRKELITELDKAREIYLNRL